MKNQSKDYNFEYGLYLRPGSLDYKKLRDVQQRAKGTSFYK